MNGICVVSPAPRDAWASVVGSDPDAVASQTPEWACAVTEGSLWRDASRLYTGGDGRRAVLPMVALGAGSAASLASPRRGWGYGGIVAEGGVTPEDIALVSADLSQVRALKLHVRPNPLHAELWEKFAPTFCRVRKDVHVLDLSGGHEAVWSGFHKSARKGVKTAERASVRIQSGTGDELLPVFFALTYKARAQWAKSQHEPVWLAQMRGRVRDSEAKWKRLAHFLGADLRVYIAWCDDQPAAAGIVLQGRNAHGARAAMDRTIANRTGASHLLNWAVIQDACSSGAHWLHLGESATKGAADFKAFLGAQRVEYDEMNSERLPFSRVNTASRTLVKKVVGFRESDSVSGVS